MNQFFINYDEQTLKIMFKGELFPFNLMNGDKGDFWHSLDVDGELFDINFHQESEAERPIVTIYNVIQDENGVRVDTSSYDSIYEHSAIGSAHDYFNPKRILYARKCDVTGKGMNNGWVFCDGEKYAKNESDAILVAKEYGYESLSEAYDDEVCYWTYWEQEIDHQYELINGVLTEID